MGPYNIPDTVQKDREDYICDETNVVIGCMSIAAAVDHLCILSLLPRQRRQVRLTEYQLKQRGVT